MGGFMFRDDDNDDSFERIFKMMDDMIGDGSSKTKRKKIYKYINFRLSERQIWKDKIFYTLVLKEHSDKGSYDISVESTDSYIEICISDLDEVIRHKIHTPYLIVPESTMFYVNNGLLDITTIIDDNYGESKSLQQTKLQEL